MFDLFKQDIKVGDKVKLFLTTGKEPEGIVVSVGDNCVKLEAEDHRQNLFFDKLIGGWTIIQKLKSSSEPRRIEKKVPIQATTLDIILKDITIFKSSISPDEIQRKLSPNAEIIEVRNHGNICIAKNSEFQKILILKNRIFDHELLCEIKNFKNGEVIPIILEHDSWSKRDVRGIFVIKSNSIDNLLNKLKEFLETGKISEAILLIGLLISLYGYDDLQFLLTKVKRLKNPADHNSNSGEIISEDTEESRHSKNIEKEINNLISQSKFDLALASIDRELKNQQINSKYKSSILLKKAQIFSSQNNPQQSEIAYKELLVFNEKIKSSPNNLSHLYTELARLQSLTAENQSLALQSLRKALRYNPNNNFAISLLHQFEGKFNKLETQNAFQGNIEGQLEIESDEDSFALSKMIDLDINEHKYSHPEILKNGSRPTTFIAQLILAEAKRAKQGDLSERYPLYLEAAKVFSGLNVGSYDLQDYLESIAFYSMLKGNSLFINFRNKVLNNDFDIINLKRLRDSACSYYSESLNLLSNIEPKLLLSILASYLKLNIIVYQIENKVSFGYKDTFKGNFAEVFKYCLLNREIEIEKIAYKTILVVGSSSVQAWNKLSHLPGGTGPLYGVLDNNETRNKIFDLINSIEENDLSHSLNPGEFFKKTFIARRERVNRVANSILNLLTFDIEPHALDSLISNWNSIIEFQILLTDTDKEIKGEIDNLFLILKPYLNRSQSERTNILIQARSIVEKQIKFINDNTTYYGRSFFYGLLKKWRRDIDSLLEEKIAQSYPLLDIIVDPPYYIDTNGEVTAPLIIKNKGEATAEGFYINICCESTEFEERVEIPFLSEIEIAAESKYETSFVIPRQILSESNAVEIKIDIQAIYQKKRLSPRNFEFTVEKEPASYLTPEDIPWKIGHSTPEKLFFGRKPLINKLAKHYKSPSRDKPYILYGLTRTGKSSILEYLRKEIDGDSIHVSGRSLRFISFEWQLQEISNNVNARDFYEDILLVRVYNQLRKTMIEKNQWDDSFTIDEKGKFGDFKRILEFLKVKGYFPVFFVDEFSYIKDLMDKNIIGKGFLAALREYSLTGLASFVFAGTYDIKKLVSDEKYGITGQLVHIIEHQVDRIEDDDSDDLICIIEEKLAFTPEALNHIKHLSGNIPYFIQIICKNCGDYAVENRRRYIGYPELEKVIKLLTGENSSEDSIILRLPSGTFQNNQYSTTDPNEVSVLISTLCFFNRGQLISRGIGSHELERFWHEKGLTSFKSRLAKSLQSLIERKILLESNDENIPVYKFSVDIFRRWWQVGHQDINLEIATLKNE